MAGRGRRHDRERHRSAQNLGSGLHRTHVDDAFRNQFHPIVGFAIAPQRELAFAAVRHILERIALHFREGDGLKFHDRGEFVHARHAAMVAERVLLSVEQRRTCECTADAAQRRSPGH